MANTFHVALYVDSIPDAVAQYRKILGIEPAKVRHDYAKFELQDPPVILSLNAGGEPGAQGDPHIVPSDVGLLTPDNIDDPEMASYLFKDKCD